MVRRTKEQWQALIEEQSTSGLTATAFCKERELNPAYFSSVKYKLKQSTQKPTGFVRVSSTAVKSSESLLIEHNGVSLKLPNVTQPDWIATLMRNLAT